MSPLLTLFCDASHCHKTGAGGWGAWAKRDLWERGYLMGGAFKQPMPSVNACELAAIVNAVVRLRSENRLFGIERIMAQSDSLHALLTLRAALPGTECAANGTLKVGKRKTPLSPFEQQAVAILRTHLDETGIALYVRHVKGHQPGGGRSWVNRECDRIARTHMEAARAGATL